MDMGRDRSGAASGIQTSEPPDAGDAGIDAGSLEAEDGPSLFALDPRLFAMESKAVADLHQRGRRIALLEPSHLHPRRSIFPANWKEFDGVLLRREELPKRRHRLLEGTVFFWQAPAIDGHLYLELTDEQLYLRSGHDNPHKNFLYWLVPSTARQHAAVVELLGREVKEGPLDCTRKETEIGLRVMDCTYRAPYSERPEWAPEHHLATTTKNLAALIDRLNRRLPSDVAPLPVPVRSDLGMNVVISDMADELNDWLHGP